LPFCSTCIPSSRIAPGVAIFRTATQVAASLAAFAALSTLLFVTTVSVGSVGYPQALFL
jgi:hypothetical protein